MGMAEAADGVGGGGGGGGPGGGDGAVVWWWWWWWWWRQGGGGPGGGGGEGGGGGVGGVPFRRFVNVQTTASSLAIAPSTLVPVTETDDRSVSRALYARVVVGEVRPRDQAVSLGRTLTRAHGDRPRRRSVATGRDNLAVDSEARRHPGRRPARRPCATGPSPCSAASSTRRRPSDQPASRSGSCSPPRRAC